MRETLPVARHDGLEHVVPAVSAVHVAGTQSTAFEVAKLVEHEQRVIAGAGGMAVPDAHLLLAVGRAHATYYAFPEEHWRRIRTNNPLERILREIRRRTRVVGAFPDGQSALNLAAARLRHIAGTAWSTKRYLNIELLKDQQMRGAITA